MVLLKKYLKINLLFKILTGIILGGIVGIILASLQIDITSYTKIVQPFGDIFIRLLKMIVVPVICFSLIAGASSISPSKLGTIGIKTMLLYLITSAFAVFFGLLAANIFKPGMGLDLATVTNAAGKTVNPTPMSQILLNIIPTNPFESLVKGDVLPIIFFSIILGIALSFLKEKGVKGAQVVLDVVNGVVEAIYVIVGAIMQYAPIGVFALISIVFAVHGKKVLGPLLFTVLIIYLVYALQLFLVYGFMFTINKLSVRHFFKSTSEALITAFVTRSSGGTLPVSIRNVESMGVPRGIASFTLPLGATVNMNGTAIYLGICAMFVGFATNHSLTISQQVTTIITATLAAIGTAGVPGAGAIMLLLVFESIGLSITEGSAVAAAYAMILGLDVLLDMGRTCLNVAGDMVCTVIVSKSEKELDTSKWRK